MGSDTDISPVRQVRLGLGLRLVDVCASAGISPGLLSMIERGYLPPVRTQQRVAGALGTVPDRFWPQVSP